MSSFHSTELLLRRMRLRAALALVCYAALAGCKDNKVGTAQADEARGEPLSAASSGGAAGADLATDGTVALATSSGDGDQCWSSYGYVTKKQEANGATAPSSYDDDCTYLQTKVVGDSSAMHAAVGQRAADYCKSEARENFTCHGVEGAGKQYDFCVTTVGAMLTACSPQAGKPSVASDPAPAVKTRETESKDEPVSAAPAAAKATNFEAQPETQHAATPAEAQAETQHAATPVEAQSELHAAEPTSEPQPHAEEPTSEPAAAQVSAQASSAEEQPSELDAGREP